MVRRSELEMKLDVLKAIQEKAWKRSEYPITQLMHDANMSWKLLQKLLIKMVDSGLVNDSAQGTLRTFRHFYFVTSKGRRAIKLYEELSSLIDEKPISSPED